ncbi:MAG TPA: hypothetical protein VMY37_30325 [Thermoguttaceae bacterium]|nr:hypothetical protein [Thermoguttaceae bacterium]
MSGRSPDIEQYIQQKVASGQFASSEEFALEAMRLYRDLEVRHELLRGDVQAALDEAEKGLSEPLDVDAIKKELIDESADQLRA